MENGNVKRKDCEMIELFGHDIIPSTYGIDLKDVTISGNKNDIKKLRNFLNSCLEEIEEGSFTGENGGHRHFNFYTNDLESKTDIVIMLNPENK